MTPTDPDQTGPDDQSCPNPISSFVEDRGRILHEDIPVPGTDMTLHYAGNRVVGYKTVIKVPASGDSVPESLKSIVVEVEVAGRKLTRTLNPCPLRWRSSYGMVSIFLEIVWGPLFPPISVSGLSTMPSITHLEISHRLLPRPAAG